MLYRTLDEVRRRLVGELRRDPPQAAGGRPGLERWLASRLSRDDVAVLFRLEELYGEGALAEWLAEAALEAGVVTRPSRVH